MQDLVNKLESLLIESKRLRMKYARTIEENKNLKRRIDDLEKRILFYERRDKNA